MNRKQRVLVRLPLTAPVLSALVLSTLVVAGTRAAEQEKAVLSLEAQIPLPRVTGRIDHFGVDVTGQRLFVAAVENHTLEVVDLKSGQRVTRLAIWASPRASSMTLRRIICLLRVALMASRRFLMETVFKSPQQSSSLMMPTTSVTTRAARA